MKTIKATQGYEALVDDEDFELVSKYKWYPGFSGKNVYLQTFMWEPTGIRGVPGRNRSVMLHRLIVGAQKGQVVDHVNHNTLDNRKDNLRVCSQRKNNANRVKNFKKTSSIYKGVGWHKATSRWRAYINLESKKHKSLGYFQTEREAAMAYNKVAAEVFGQFALLNDVRE